MTRLVILAPHPDDECIGCGLLLATHPNPDDVHIVFVSDGAGQEGEHYVPAARRADEARAAASVFGIGEKNLHFLGFEDGQLMPIRERIRIVLGELLDSICPVQVHAPFRYDHHPDHRAVNRIAASLIDSAEVPTDLHEYFVYARSRLVPGGDLRQLVDPALLVRIKAESGANEKRRRAIECHQSQVDMAGRSGRAVLSREFLDHWSGEDELHLRYLPSIRGNRVLTRARNWVPLATRVEPVLKRWSDRLRGRG